MQKVQNMESIDIQSDYKTTCEKKTDSSSVFTRNGKVQKGRESVNTQNDYKKSKRWTDRKKRNLYCEFRKSV